VHTGYWWGNLKEIAIGRPGGDERMILNWIFRNGGQGLGLVGSVVGPACGSCECIDKN